MKYCDLTICVPAYNEAAGIKTTLEGLRAKFLDAEIIVINDGSNRVISFLRGLNYAN